MRESVLRGTHKAFTATVSNNKHSNPGTNHLSHSRSQAFEKKKHFVPSEAIVRSSYRTALQVSPNFAFFSLSLMPAKGVSWPELSLASPSIFFISLLSTCVAWTLNPSSLSIVQVNSNLGKLAHKDFFPSMLFSTSSSLSASHKVLGFAPWKALASEMWTMYPVTAVLGTPQPHSIGMHAHASQFNLIARQGWHIRLILHGCPIVRRTN